MSDIIISTETKPEETPEQAEQRMLDSIKKVEYRSTPKFRKWCELFLDDTKQSNGQYNRWFGNKTWSAVIAYGLDPKTQYWSANQIGRENFQKLSNANALLLEKQGVNEQTLVAVAAQNMLKTKDPRWHEIVSNMLGATNKTEVTVQTNIQNNFFQDLKEKYKK